MRKIACSVLLLMGLVILSAEVFVLVQLALYYMREIR